MKNKTTGAIPESESKIVELLWQRDEKAIEMLEITFGKLILSVCNNILNNHQDSEECSNMVYEKLWNTIPPEKPRSLKAYLIRITRCVALDKFRFENRLKRISSNMTVSLDDFSDFLTDDYSLENEFFQIELERTLNDFVCSLPRELKSIFVKRYYYFQSIAAIACEDGLKVGYVKKQLKQIRIKLKHILTEGGYVE